MSTGREAAFERALSALRGRLREGAFPPGARVPASALAARLRLSATPVREALSRLAGEGLVEERRHQGFFVRALSGGEAADLYRLALAHLLILGAGGRGGRPPRLEPPAPDPVVAVEALLQGWAAAAGSRALAESFRAVATRLGPLRRAEPQVFGDLGAEADALLTLAATGAPAAFVQALRRFHGRRIQAADRLVTALNRKSNYRVDID